MHAPRVAVGRGNRADLRGTPLLPGFKFHVLSVIPRAPFFSRTKDDGADM